MFYETQEMTVTQAISFVHKFDKLIGTDRELNKSDDFHGYVICMDLEPNEVDICRKIEDKATK